MTLPATAGGKVRASDVNAATQQAAWTAFAPAWTATGTTPSVGNGFITGSYSKIGRLCTFRWAIQFGSTTSFGTGTWLLSLPFSPALGLHADTMVGNVYGFNSGTANYTGAAIVGNMSAFSTLMQIVSSGAGSSWSTSVPSAWNASSSSYIAGTITYETTT